MMRLLLAALLIASVSFGCSDDPAPAKDTRTSDVTAGDAAGDGARADAKTPDGSADAPLGPVTCTLGTVYPGAVAINPDNPDYEGDGKTKAEVAQMFAQAKADNTDAYKAYKAAWLYPELTECAFCSCGCSLLSNHKSAIDCFKDMHGFT